MKKISSLIFVLILCAFFVTGCEEQEVITSGGEEVNVTKMQHKHCTREGTIDTGSQVSLNYDIYYTGEALNLLKSEEKVISSDQNVLTTYENAYKKIHANYEGLEYYDTEVVRGDTTVTSTIVINYDKVNIDQLLAIEGEEDNIIENGEAKVDKWLTLAKKFGTKCEDVTEEKEENSEE